MANRASPSFARADNGAVLSGSNSADGMESSGFASLPDNMLMRAAEWRDALDVWAEAALPAIALLALAVGLLLTIYLAGRLTRRPQGNEGMRNTPEAALRSAIGWLGLSASAIAGLATLAFGVQGLVVTVGIAWIVVALLLAPAMRDVLAGLTLARGGSLQPGSRISSRDIEGRIRRVGTRAVEIERPDGGRAIISHRTLLDAGLDAGLEIAAPGAAPLSVAIAVTVTHDADTEFVRAILLTLGQSYPRRTDATPAHVAFEAITSEGLRFVLSLTVTSEAEISLADVRSELRTVLVKAFREAGIEIASPQRGLRLRDLDGLKAAIGRARSARAAPPKKDER